MKVVWLCHFANNDMKKRFSTFDIKEFSPWINNLIILFKNNPGIELHIVSPNIYTNKDCTFLSEGINYHFFQYTPISTNNKFFIKAYKYFDVDYFMGYFWVKNKILKIIKNIKPDMIHLHGAENPYYSAGILSLIGKYPIITTIQGFIRHSLQKKHLLIRHKILLEEKILKNCLHFGIRTNEMSQTIKDLNPKAIMHFHNYPITIPDLTKDSAIPSEFDIVFFARVCKNKGIEDLLKAISLIKKEKNDINLHIIGAVKSSYEEYIKKLITLLGIQNNVKFIGFFETQQELYSYCVKAKICVLPTYYDIIPGTIIESMFLKIPVIAYAVGDIPSLNQTEETLLLVEKNNIKELASKIVWLLNNPKLQIEMAQKAFSLAHQRFNNNEILVDINNAYNSVLNYSKNHE